MRMQTRDHAPAMRALRQLAGRGYNAVNEPVQFTLHIFQAGENVEVAGGGVSILEIPYFLDPKSKTEERHGFVDLVLKTSQIKRDFRTGVTPSSHYNKNLMYPGLPQK